MADFGFPVSQDTIINNSPQIQSQKISLFDICSRQRKIFRNFIRNIRHSYQQNSYKTEFMCALRKSCHLSPHLCWASPRHYCYKYFKSKHYLLKLHSVIYLIFFRHKNKNKVWYSSRQTNYNMHPRHGLIFINITVYSYCIYFIFVKCC